MNILKIALITLSLVSFTSCSHFSFGCKKKCSKESCELKKKSCSKKDKADCKGKTGNCDLKKKSDKK